jgi:hypothetical protein
MKTFRSLVFITVVACSLCEAGKKKDPPPPIQADIIRGCVAVRSIVFARPARFNPYARVGLSGVIENSCNREVQVTIRADFYSADGSSIDSKSVEKLVQAGVTPFMTGPEPDDENRLNMVTARVTDVFARYIGK